MLHQMLSVLSSDEFLSSKDGGAAQCSGQPGPLEETPAIKPST
jgi:hypothetical protein